jgi:hypothetical protein
MSRKSNPRCKSRRCPKPKRRSVRIFQSVPTTARALSKEASLGAFLSWFVNILLMLYFK